MAKAHVGHLGSIEAIADEKASVMAGLKPGGIAVLPADSEQLGRMRAAAGGAAVLTFGVDDAADVRLIIEDGEAAGDFVYTTVDHRTGAVIRQLPRDGLLKLGEAPDYAAGALIKTRV